MGPTVGAFELLEPIGRGGVGHVWRAVHIPTGHPAAVKLLRDAHSTAGWKSFEAEIGAFAALEHPHIVRILDQGRTDAPIDGAPAGAPWLALELVGGGTAAEPSLMPQTWSGVVDLLVQVLEALAHAHAHGLIHRDVKPANILRATGPYPAWKLGDFGLAQTRSDQGVQAATWAYAAPEQLARGDQGPGTDLFAVGAVAWRLLTGAPPFAKHHKRVLPAFRPGFSIPDGVESWMRTLMADRPHQRFALAPDARAALLALGDISPSAETDTTLELPPVDDVPTEVIRVVQDPEHPPAASTAGAPPLAPWPTDWRWAHVQPPPVLLQGAGLGLFALRARPVIGRAALRDRLWASLDAVRRGGARGVMLTDPDGDAGEVAAWLGHRAMELGAAETWWVDEDQSLEGLVTQVVGTRHRAERLRGVGVHDLVVEACTGTLGPGDAHVVGPLLHAGARRRPVVLIVPDGDAVPWLVDALEEWLKTTPRASVLVVVARRDRAGPEPWQHVAVGPLSRSEMTQYVQRLLPLDPSLAAWVVEEADGRARVAWDLVAAWVEADALVLRDLVFALEGAPSAQVGHSAWARWYALRSSLAPGGLEAVQGLALLGAEATMARWERLGPIPEGLFAQLVKAGMLRAGTRLRWTDPAVVDACLGELAPRQRKRLHRQVAEVLSATDGPSGAVGTHRLLGGQPEGALLLLLDGADRARVAGRTSETLVLVQRTLEALALVEGGERRVERSTALRLQGWVLDSQGHGEEAAAALKDAVSVARAADDPDASVLALRARASLLRRHGNLEVALRCVLGGRLWAERSSTHAASLFLELALVHRARRMHHEALLALHEALARSEPGGSIRADVLLFLAYTHVDLGEDEAGITWAKQAGTAYGALSMRHGVAGVEAFLGAMARRQGDPEQADGHLQRALALQSTAVDRAVTLTHVGVVRAMQGRHEEAVETLLEALAVFEQARFRRMERFAHAVLLWPLAALARWAAFDHHLLGARALLDGDDIEADAAEALLQGASAVAAAKEWTRCAAVVALARVQVDALGDDGLQQRLALVEQRMEGT